MLGSMRLLPQNTQLFQDDVYTRGYVRARRHSDTSTFRVLKYSHSFDKHSAAKSDRTRKTSDGSLLSYCGQLPSPSCHQMPLHSRQGSMVSCSSSNKSRTGSFACPPSPDISESHDVEEHHIVVYGTSAVGKTTIIRQMKSSDFAVQTDVENGQTEEGILLVLDGKQSRVKFFESDLYVQLYGGVQFLLVEERTWFQCNNQEETTDLANFLTSRQDHDQTQMVDAYMVVYSVADKCSYDFAVHVVQEIRNKSKSSKPVFLVANKADIKRFRAVNRKDVTKLAQDYKLKYVETSVSRKLDTDALLTGLVLQTRQWKRRDNVLNQQDQRQNCTRLKKRPSFIKRLRKFVTGKLNESD